VGGALWQCEIAEVSKGWERSKLRRLQEIAPGRVVAGQMAREDAANDQSGSSPRFPRPGPNPINDNLGNAEAGRPGYPGTAFDEAVSESRPFPSVPTIENGEACRPAAVETPETGFF
jgi:hypothetical protein